MTIRVQVLGQPGQDNAMLVHIDSGQGIDRLLFDCGEDCLREQPLAEIQAIDHLCFSHLHMDHVAGFDSFFRANFNRDSKPNHIWGPPSTTAILQGRLRGYMWNLYENDSGTWFVHDVAEQEVHTSRFEMREAFDVCHDEGCRPFTGLLLEQASYSIETLHMDHRTPSLAYIVREAPRHNIDLSRLQTLGLRSGPWLRQLKQPEPGQTHLDIAGQQYALAELRQALLVTTPGDAVAYLTDFRLDEAAMQRLVPALRGCSTVVCECQYRREDQELARRNYHMTTTQVGELAHRADVGELILFHLSQRYTAEQWRAMLTETQMVFPRARFPASWPL
jgi:ribonuclease Z